MNWPWLTETATVVFSLSVVVPVRKGPCCLGRWQQAIGINDDIKPQTRRIEPIINGF